VVAASAGVSAAAASAGVADQRTGDRARTMTIGFQNSGDDERKEGKR
jgi:hypothetical protein